MCGIVGCWHFGQQSEDLISHQIDLMSSKIEHRGPDGSGVWVDARVGIGFGHRRLAIVGEGDVGAQPMVSHDGRWVISYNGEIYNFRNLANLLGCSQTSDEYHSDTRLILSYVEKFGPEKTIKNINGMYSFALFDQWKKTLYLVRDKMGIKPLYLSLKENSIFFASEITPIVGVIADLGVNLTAFSSFLTSGNIPHPMTIFEGVDKVQPAQIVKISFDGTIEKSVYWKPQFHQINQIRNDGCGLETAVAELGGLITSSVRRQLVADVPVGIFLSGGIDSALIGATAAEFHDGMRSFSLGFYDEDFDETARAELTAKKLGLKHTSYLLGDHNVLDIVQALPKIFGEPFSDSSQIPTIYLSKMVSQEVKVALSGDGGDELLGGYVRYLFARNWSDKIKKIPAISIPFLQFLLKRLAVNSLATSSLNGFSPNSSNKLGKLAGLLGKDDFSIYKTLLAQGLCASRYANRDFSLPPGAFNFPDELPNLFDKMRMADIQGYMTDDVLTKVDRSSMAYGLEVRPPFLDSDVVEFCLSLPQELLVQGSRGKILARQLLEKHGLSAVNSSPKKGFSVPLSRWFSGPLNEFVNDTFSSTGFGGGFFDQNLVREDLNKLLSGDRTFEHALWTVMCFETWRLQHRVAA
ncbi:asparagine synthase (glutamine-hydrolyzing) [Paracoccaceae bacterium]|nr:asparagine synthase (glutamine-hydrolyzing) [Paracoccaceae bacterium]